MRARGRVAIGMLLGASALHGTASAIGRTLGFWALYRMDSSPAAMGKVWFVAVVLAHVFALAGGGLAFLIGPRAVATLAALLAALGCGALAVAPSLLATEVGLGVLLVGSQMFLPCLVAAAAETLGAEEVGLNGVVGAPTVRLVARVAGCAALFHATEAFGYLVGPAMGGGMGSAGSARFGLGVAAGIGFVAFLASGGAALLGRRGRTLAPAAPVAVGPYRATMAPGNPESARGGTSNSLGGIAMFGAAWTLYEAAHHLANTAKPQQRGAETLTAALTVVAMLVAFVLAGMWFIAATRAWTLPPLRVWGVGVTISAVGFAIFATGLRGAGVVACGTAFTMIAQPLIVTSATTYAALSVRPRAATLMIGLFALSSLLGSLFVQWMGAQVAVAAPIWLITIACAGLGVGAALAAPRLHRKLLGSDPR